MKPYVHAESSVKKFGGKVDDYLEIHDMMDCSKAIMADPRHRSIFHSAFGIYIIEQVFGHVIKNSDGKNVSVRDIAEQHVLEDLGFIPSLEKWLSCMTLEDWMSPHLSKANKKVSPSEPSVTVPVWDETQSPGITLTGEPYEPKIPVNPYKPRSPDYPYKPLHPGYPYVPVWDETQSPGIPLTGDPYDPYIIVKD